MKELIKSKCFFFESNNQVLDSLKINDHIIPECCRVADRPPVSYEVDFS